MILLYFNQDKATVEMECMEEGYLAKIVHGDGSKEIKVGEVCYSINIFVANWLLCLIILYSLNCL